VPTGNAVYNAEGHIAVWDNISNLRALGCQCWYFLPKVNRDTKLGPHMAEARLTGYDTTGYIVYDIRTKQMKRSRDVVFNENPISSLSKPDCQIEAIPNSQPTML
jgi:hypothetical protein